MVVLVSSTVRLLLFLPPKWPTLYNKHIVECSINSHYLIFSSNFIGIFKIKTLLIENFYKFVAYGAGQQQTTVVLTQPQNVLVRQTFREVPVRLNCPKCNADIMTATTYEVGMLTWLACGGMCLVGLWLGCCLIPFCVDACKDVVHTCPNCQQMVGKYSRLS